MSADDIPFPEEKSRAPEIPLDSPVRVGRILNVPIYEEALQWRLKIQPFSQGGFEARATLVDRNKLAGLIYSNQTRQRRPRDKDRDKTESESDRQKAAYRAARRVRHLCIEIRADRMLTLTSRGLLREFDQVIQAWKRFMRLVERAEAKFRYVAVPELHGSGEHFHIHVAINGYLKAELMRRCWQIALGGRGNERGQDALGNVDIKSRRYGKPGPSDSVKIARYLSKYITKGYLENHRFNRKRYWASRDIRLPEETGEWLSATEKSGVINELVERFGGSMFGSMISNGLYMPETGRPMIFMRWMPDMGELDVPF
ncbi:MAG: hypothetical protein WBX11_15115 [Thiobacillaceae bacterium]